MPTLMPELTHHEPVLSRLEEVQLLQGTHTERFVFMRGQLLASYESDDLFTRNFLIVQLFLTHKVKQRVLSAVFELTIPHISRMVKLFRQQGSEGLVDKVNVRIKNNQKMTPQIAVYLSDVLSGENKSSYEQVAAQVENRFGIKLSAGRIGNWWRAERKIRMADKESHNDIGQLDLVDEETVMIALQPHESTGDKEENSDEPLAAEFVVDHADIHPEGQRHYNVVAGSFLLYSMLHKSQFLSPFLKGIRGKIYQGKKSVERVMLTLFFMHALRLKSIEQTKHLVGEHFGELVLGDFYRQQTLRYAIDDIVEHKRFDQVVAEHFKNLSEQTDRGDEIYYVDGHFSCYYGSKRMPKGYDARRKQAARGRNSIYLHNSLGYNVLSFESPTNTSLSVDIVTLLKKMEDSYDDIKGKTLFFDRGGFSSDCFKAISAKGMYFTTYLKHRKKGSELDEALFEEVEIELAGEKIKNRIAEKEQVVKAYGRIRTIVFIGKQGKQIPVITTNLTLSGAEIVARLQKRWVEENGFKYMGEHYQIDLLTTYKIEDAPDKIMSRRNPDRKDINGVISSKKQSLKKLKEDYADCFSDVKEKDKMTIEAFEEQEKKLLFAIDNLKVDIGLLELEKKDIPTKVISNLKDECVISKQKRRMLINLVKAMNYNSEKWLQELFCKYHRKQDETLSLIRQVLKTPGRVRESLGLVEVELDRLDSKIQASSLDGVLGDLEKSGDMKLPDGRRLVVVQAN